MLYPKVLVPVSVTPAMLSSSSLSEPAAGETVYSDVTTYAQGVRVISTATHRIYESVQASNIGHDPTLEASRAWWLDAGPTARWAAFDGNTSTASTSTTSLSYVLRPGFCNALFFYGLIGAAIDVSIKDAPGGTVIYHYTAELAEPPSGWYEYFFGTVKALSKIALQDLPLRPDPEITITITAATGVTVGVGMIAMGDLRSLLYDAEWGGTEHGASVDPITYSYIKTDEYGTTTIVRRHAATNMALRIVMPKSAADYALRTVQEVLDVPAAWIGSGVPGTAGLNTFGLASGSLSYDSFGHAVLNLKVQGMI